MENHGFQIAVLDRGFVYVGDITSDEDWVYIKNARNIRLWGTTKGLGELRLGPTAKTVHDEMGEVKASRRALLHLIATDKAKWHKCDCGKDHS
jgi:hypothetical protein